MGCGGLDHYTCERYPTCFASLCTYPCTVSLLLIAFIYVVTRALCELHLRAARPLLMLSRMLSRVVAEIRSLYGPEAFISRSSWSLTLERSSRLKTRQSNKDGRRSRQLPSSPTCLHLFVPSSANLHDALLILPHASTPRNQTACRDIMVSLSAMEKVSSMQYPCPVKPSEN